MDHPAADSLPIRVVHLINHLGYGGTERQLFLLIASSQPQQLTHRVVVFNDSPERVYDDQLEALGAQVEVVPPSCNSVPKRLRFLVNRLRQWRPHVVHSWTVHDNPYSGLAGALARVPVRWGSLRGTWYTEGLQSQSRAARWMMLHSVQKIVVNSLALEGELRDMGVPPKKILRQPNCVPLNTAAAADLADLGIDPDTVVLGMVGNLRQVKNHSLFVRAMADVVAGNPSVRALIVGQDLPSEPEYRAGLQAEIDGLGLTDHVILTGFRQDVPSLLRRIRALCLTSHSEGLPNAVLEAMAAGKAVVACRVGGVPDLVTHGVEGLLVDPNDVAKLARALRILVGDPESAERMGCAGRDRVVRQFGCEAAASRMAIEYRRALEES